jgi:hypothetical protein
MEMTCWQLWEMVDVWVWGSWHMAGTQAMARAGGGGVLGRHISPCNILPQISACCVLLHGAEHSFSREPFVFLMSGRLC